MNISYFYRGSHVSLYIELGKNRKALRQSIAYKNIRVIVNNLSKLLRLLDSRWFSALFIRL